jgi:hypothetical protein
MRKTFSKAGVCLFGLTALVHGTTLINFEAPLPAGLTPNNFISGSPVLPASELTTQYDNVGVLFSSAGGAPFAALIDLTGQAPSGVNGVGAVNTADDVDYTVDLDIFLVVPGTTTPAVTDSISIQGDEEPIAGNVIFTAYDVNGNLLTSGIAPDTAGGVYQLSAAGIHEFRLHSTSGTVAYDNLSFDIPGAPPVNGSAPEPGTTGFIALGISSFLWIQSGRRRAGKRAA